MNTSGVWILGIVATGLTAFASPAFNLNLGTSGSFAILGGSGVTNTGATDIWGNVGVWNGTSTSITGFPLGSISGNIDAGDSVAMQAQTDLATAYNTAAGESCSGSNVLNGQDLGALNLVAGVYCFDSSAQLTGSLTLDAQGDPNAVFIFQIGSTLTTASDSSVLFANNLRANLFWQVGSSATLGTGTVFAGNILALKSITLTTGASIQCGSALAQTGAVTLDTNSVDIGNCQTPGGVPEPGAGTLLGVGLLVGLIKYAVISRVVPFRRSL